MTLCRRSKHSYMDTLHPRMLIKGCPGCHRHTRRGMTELWPSGELGPLTVFDSPEFRMVFTFEIENQK